MYTALLMDGSDNPVALRIDQQENTIHVPTIKNRFFRFVSAIKSVLIYRANDLEMKDDEFKQLADQHADMHLNPAKYSAIKKKARMAAAKAK